MICPPAPPQPPTNSSMPGFKTNLSSLDLNRSPAQETPTLLEARDAMLGIIAALRAQRHLAGLDILTTKLSEEGAAALFNHAVAAFIVDPVPPPVISSGHNVELLGLYMAARSRGGFSIVAESKSWEAVAMDIGLDRSCRSEIELMYAEYITPWEILIRGGGGNKVDQEMVDISDDAGQSLKDPKEDDKIVSVTIDAAPPAPSVGPRKRKMRGQEGTINWLHMVAKSPDEPGILKWNSYDHVSRLAQLQNQMCANIDCSPQTSWKNITRMFNWVRSVARSLDGPGVIGKDFSRHFATAIQVRSQMFAPNVEHGLPSLEITECDVWDNKIATILCTYGIFGQKNCQADIPEWTGKPSLPDEDPKALRFLGEYIWIPESNLELNCGSISMGMQDDCEGLGSITCARTRVVEKKLTLKRELGAAAFSKLGLDRMGENVALTWTCDEEMEFCTTIQQNRSSSKLWEKLLLQCVPSPAKSSSE